jgi:acyl-CoA thioesterase
VLPILGRLDTRLHPDHARAGQLPVAEISGWNRFVDDRPPDTRSLLLFTDTFPPSPFSMLGVIGWVPTIELTVHVRRRPAPGWIQARLHCEDLHQGRMVESGALWDSNGDLVAQCRQIGLVMDRN